MPDIPATLAMDNDDSDGSPVELELDLQLDRCRKCTSPPLHPDSFRNLFDIHSMKHMWLLSLLDR